MTMTKSQIKALISEMKKFRSFLSRKRKYYETSSIPHITMKYINEVISGVLIKLENDKIITVYDLIAIDSIVDSLHELTFIIWYTTRSDEHAQITKKLWKLRKLTSDMVVQALKQEKTIVYRRRIKYDTLKALKTYLMIVTPSK